MKLVTKREFNVDSIKIYLHLFKLYKSYLLLISDEEELGIGSITMATPLYLDGKLLLLFFKMITNEQEIASSLIKAINQVLSDIKAS